VSICSEEYRQFVIVSERKIDKIFKPLEAMYYPRLAWMSTSGVGPIHNSKDFQSGTFFPTIKDFSLTEIPKVAAPITFSICIISKAGVQSTWNTDLKYVGLFQQVQVAQNQSMKGKVL
jgi:hypothetical protein